MTRFPNRLAAIAVLVALIGGCEAPQPLGPAGSVADFISRVSTADGSVQAVLREGTPPVASAAAAPTEPAAGTAGNGGSAKFPVEATIRKGASERSKILRNIVGLDSFREGRRAAAYARADHVALTQPYH